MNEDKELQTEEVEATQVDPDTVEDSETNEDTSETERDEVSKLKDEAAQSRIKARETSEKLQTALERLQAATVASVAAGILSSPQEDLAWSDEWLDDEGWPDADKVREAAEALATRRPALARVRGNVGQGHHSASHGTPSLSELLKLA